MSGRPRSATSAFGAEDFTLVWLSGLTWHLTRWGVAFLGTFGINEMTGSPRLVQLAGTMLYAPLLLGGVLGGVVSDRFDRLATVRIQLAVLVPLSIGIGLLVRADRAPVWLIYAYMFAVGIGWITDMTSRRALVFDLVGGGRIDHAMAMEAISLSVGMILGALVGGSAVEAVGVGSAYFCIAGLLLISLGLLAPVRSRQPLREASPGSGSGAESSSPLAELRTGLAELRSQPEVIGILGVTVIANLFLFAYFPIVPVVAERLDATPFLVGLLSAGTGIGMMAGSALVARWRPRRRGLAYIGGLYVAMVLVVPFGLSAVYGLALAAIIVSGFGSGLFGATQTTLVMASAPEHLRGRALGLLSMAIGALPVGMYALGELAERVGVRAALTTNVAVGLVALTLWSIRHPETARLTVDEPPGRAVSPLQSG